MLTSIQRDGEFKPEKLIQAFTHQLNDGNLFIPGFINTLNNGDTIDMRTQPPETGGLSKFAFSDFKKSACSRTNDPFHSFFVYGKSSGEIVQSTLNNTDTFGENSVFGYLHRKKGILIIFDLALYYGFTFAHY